VDSISGSVTDRLKPRAIGKGIPQKIRERIDIAARKNEFRINRRDKISCRSDAIANRDRTSTAHRLVHNYAEGLIFGGKNHKVCGRVNGREL